MSIPTELLAAASAAVAGAMGTDAWGYARGRVAELWKRHGAKSDGEADMVSRLDTLEQAMSALEPNERIALARGVQAPVAEILASCVDTDHPEALQELINDLTSRMGEAHTVIAHQTVTGNVALGNINTAGRDNKYGGDY